MGYKPLQKKKQDILNISGVTLSLFEYLYEPKIIPYSGLLQRTLPSLNGRKQPARDKYFNPPPPQNEPKTRKVKPPNTFNLLELKLLRVSRFAARGLHPSSSPLFPEWNVPHRFLQVAAGQLAVLGVVVEDRAELKMCPGLDPLWRLELKHRL